MRGLRVLPILILLLVALHQLWLARTADLSAWSGGGFGMFSTTDAGAIRHLHAFAIRPGLVREVRAPSSLDTSVRRVLTLPSETHLRALARALAGLPAPEFGPPAAVRIQVWRTRFDPDTLAPRSELLRGLEVAHGGD